jgi:hypothetical protein
MLTSLSLSSYKSLSPRTRALFGLGLIANAALAIQFSDQIEDALGLKPTKEEEKELKERLPKISRVDRT